jgi:hypothetical protein
MANDRRAMYDRFSDKGAQSGEYFGIRATALDGGEWLAVTDDGVTKILQPREREVHATHDPNQRKGKNGMRRRLSPMMGMAANGRRHLMATSASVVDGVLKFLLELEGGEDGVRHRSD